MAICILLQVWIEPIIIDVKKVAEAINDAMFKDFRYNGIYGNATKIIYSQCFTSRIINLRNKYAV
jgi:hypothetical protein